ncbi:MAG: preprotein translocase subunit SecG [Candidatus Neomarinimicrobiota bacterium]|jgi:preprotein translocase subunit SecG
MIQFLITIHTIISILLIVVVLMQSGQGGLNSMMSGTASSMMGSTGANDFITKLTTGLGIAFIGLAMLIGALSGESSATSESILQKDAESRQVDEVIPQEFSLPAADELIPEESSTN